MFVSLLRWVSSVATVVPLPELLARLRSGRSVRGLVALTFDDAYDSLNLIQSDLMAENTPLTIFATTGLEPRFWWDRLDDIYPRLTPPQWEALQAAIGVPDSYRHGQPAAFGPLRPARQWILAQYHGRWPEAGEEALSGLERQLGGTRQHAMTAETLRRWADTPGVSVGVHTHTHRLLPSLPEAEVRAEISLCLEVLRSHGIQPVPLLAIPYGLYSPSVIRAALDAGMTACLTLGERTLLRHHDAVCVPRITITSAETGWKLVAKLTGMRELLTFTSGPPSPPALPSAST